MSSIVKYHPSVSIYANALGSVYRLAAGSAALRKDACKLGHHRQDRQVVGEAAWTCRGTNVALCYFQAMSDMQLQLAKSEAHTKDYGNEQADQLATAALIS